MMNLQPDIDGLKHGGIQITETRGLGSASGNWNHLASPNAFTLFAGLVVHDFDLVLLEHILAKLRIIEPLRCVQITQKHGEGDLLCRQIDFLSILVGALHKGILLDDSLLVIYHSFQFERQEYQNSNHDQ